MTIWGASAEEWAHFDLGLGLTEDLLPVVSNPAAKISPASKMKGLGKTPSWYNGQGFAAGISDWTQRITTGEEIERWSAQPDYGICIQTRALRALDIDIEDEALAKEIAHAFEEAIGSNLARRIRRNSGKLLAAFEIVGDFPKRTFKVDGGLVEFLGTGQQFVAVGTHTSGTRYEWQGGLPDSFVTVEPSCFERAWNILVERFAIDGTDSRSRARERGASFDVVDERADWLEASAWTNYGFGNQGQLFIECPWKEGHSSDSGETECAYFPAGTGGYEQGHYKCLHASCAARTDSDFDVAVGYAASAFDCLPAEIVDEHGDMVEEVFAPAFARGGKNGDGPPKATINNVVTALEKPEWFGADIAYDEFRGEIVFSPYGKGQWRPIKDADLVAMRRRFDQRGFDAVGPEIMRSSVLLVAEKRKFDSAKLWLGGLEWDGVPRVDRFMAEHFQCADSEYATAVGRYWWSAHAGRVLDPGCQCDMVPILVSEEGKYKSTTLQAMVPSMDNFIEIDLEHKDADLSRKMRGALLGELAELRGLQGRSAEANKAWVTRRFEEWTPKYVEHTTRLSRRLIFVGTTNRDTFLGDSTGERRWLPIRVGNADPVRLAAERNQLWAEGAVLFKAHGVLWQDAYALGPAAREDFKDEDIWQSAVIRWIEGGNSEVVTEGERAKFYTLEEVFLAALGMSSSKLRKSDEMRMGDILRGLGFIRKTLRVRGRLAKVWAPPVTTCNHLSTEVVTHES